MSAHFARVSAFIECQGAEGEDDEGEDDDEDDDEAGATELSDRLMPGLQQLCTAAGSQLRD